VLTESDVRRVIDHGSAVELMERALVEFSAGAAVNPLRTVLYAGDSQRYVGVMPAFSPSGEALGAKLVTSFAANKLVGLPSHFATIILLDENTGALRSVIDGRLITEMRTAAVTAVACRHLVPRPLRTIALLGAGVQARGHVEVLDVTFELAELRVWSPGDTLQPFVREMAGRLRTPLVGAASAEEAARGADAVVLVTDSAVPAVNADWIDGGTLVVSVGACRPDHRELDPDLLARSWFIVDSRAAALHESGDFIMGLREGRFGPEHIRGELGEVIAGRVAARRSPEDVVVFKSLGLAVEDVTTAAWVCARAEARGIGQSIRL
jgi:ornithine cyclodeaminase/alanine dehydrogenase-like protein (mu-crystallin family)